MMRCMALPRLLLRHLVTAACCALGLSACTTTGTAFKAAAVQHIVPGETTFEQASAILGAHPVDTYRQLNGALTARWAHKASVLTDAIYHRQELWLAFGPDGRFDHVVQSINVPARVQPAGSAVAIAQTAKGDETTAVNPLAAASAEPLYKPAVTYPLSQ